MRSFGETPGKREALLNKLVKISETPVKREETPEKGEEPLTARNLQQMNMPPEQIAQAVGADIDTVRKWLSDS